MAQSNQQTRQPQPAPAPAEQTAPPARVVDAAKNKKFLEIGNKRVPKALAAIEAVRRLANTRDYDWTDAQRDKLVAAFQKAAEKLAASFRDDDTESGSEGGFF